MTGVVHAFEFPEITTLAMKNGFFEFKILLHFITACCKDIQNILFVNEYKSGMPLSQNVTAHPKLKMLFWKLVQDKTCIILKKKHFQRNKRAESVHRFELLYTKQVISDTIVKKTTTSNNKLNIQINSCLHLLVPIFKK